MATFLRRFARPETLKSIKPSRLIQFLQPHQAYLASRGLQLPAVAKAVGFDHQALIDILMSPDPKTPNDLIDALYYVDEMSAPEALDGNLEAAREKGVTLDDAPDQSPADVAVQIWLLDRELLERQHAERSMLRVRSFEYFQTDRTTPPQFKPPSAKQVQPLEQGLDDWFADRKRGRGARVFVFPKPDGVWFLVRHGEPVKREESIADNASTSSVCYRPVKYDVLVYQPKIGELRINAQSKGVKDLYRRQFGRHLFGDENFFPGVAKFNLEPLRKSGPASLACADIAGIEWVVLKQVELFWGGSEHEVEVRRADDVFAALEERGESLPGKPRITQAVFLIKFADSKRPRSVRIKPSNVAQYTRDGDADRLEQWFLRRGFVVANAGKEYEAA